MKQNRFFTVIKGTFISFMDKLDEALHRLSKINPDEGFVKASKARLMSKVQAQPFQEDWMKGYFQEGRFEPSESFIGQARIRLMTQIKQWPKAAQAPLQGLALFFRWSKRILASTFVMFVAATVVLFQLEGGRVVQASDYSYLELVAGSASIKPDKELAWNQVIGKAEVHAGDLIQVNPDSQAILHFFDGTEVRLNQDTTLLISQLAFSPSFKDQAIIETSLESGEAWVQTLNVDDGYASFTMITREAVLRALNASFNVNSHFNQATEVAIFKGSADVSLFDTNTGQRVKKTRLTQNKYLLLELSHSSQPTLIESDFALAQSNWASVNLVEDQKHLAKLRQKDFSRLALVTGSLPGDALYSVKKAKESLKLALSDNQDLSVRINIANSRLNEAILLFEKGEIKEGQEALLAYQAMTREITETKRVLAENQPSSKPLPADKLLAQLVVPHQKILSIQPTDKNSLEVKEVLNKTAEHLAENPLELESIRLKNSIASLQDINDLVDSGQIDLAKEKLGQYKMANVRVAALDDLGDDNKKRDAYQEALNMRQEEAGLLAIVSEKTVSLDGEDEDILELAASASQVVAESAEQIKEAALPLMPELTNTEEIKPVNPLEVKAKLFAEKIRTYTSWDAQFNEIQRLLGDDLNDIEKIEFLKLVKGFLNGRAQNYLVTRILQLQNKIAVLQNTPNKSPISTDANPTPVTVQPVPDVQETTVAATEPSNTTVDATTDPVGTSDAEPISDPTIEPTTDPTQVADPITEETTAPR